MRRLVIIILTIGSIYLAGYWAWYGYLPPQTPHKVLSQRLGKPIPGNWKVDYFYQQWSPMQSDGMLKAVIEVPEENLTGAEEYMSNPKQFSDAVELMADTCFKKSMITADLTKLLDANSKGLFTCDVNERVLKGEKMGDRVFFDDSKVLVLDKHNRRLLVYILYM